MIGMSSGFTVVRRALVVGVSLVAISGAAHAQEPAPPSPAPAPAQTGSSLSQNGDIIVTAQFREQRLQDTPIAITAVTRKCLRRAARPISPK